MEVKTITIPEIQKKPFEVLTSTRNVLRMHNYQIAVLKAGEDIEQGDTLAQTQASANAANEILSFIRAILKLDDEQYDKLLDVEYEKAQEIANKLVGYMYGLTDEQMAEEEAEEDPKEEA